MSSLPFALTAATALCVAFAASVRAEVPVDVPLAPEMVMEVPDPDVDSEDRDCDVARIRALDYLEPLETEHIDYDARRWIRQGFVAIGCAWVWAPDRGSDW